MTEESDYILAEFKGTYRAPHPEGIRDANVTRQFHVKVKIRRECLQAPGLNGFFENYYKEFLRKAYPDMIDLYQFGLVQCLELDGGVIDDPKALDHDGLLRWIQKRKLPINAMLYSPEQLRNEIVLHQQDPSGQQYLEKKLQDSKGGMLAIAKELQSVEGILTICGDEPKAKAPAKPAGLNELLKPKKEAAGATA